MSSRYSSPAGVEAAIKAAAQEAAHADPSMSASDRISQEYFRRFLSRVFSNGGDPQWVLKGGTGILARVGSARSTRDIDLLHRKQSLEGALDELKKSVMTDLGDFFRFEYVEHTD